MCILYNKCRIKVHFLSYNKKNWNIIFIYLTSWPFGPALSVLRCGRCFGAVSVLVQSVYRWGWYLRSLRDCRSPARLMIQFCHCYLYLGHLSYFHNININFSYKSNAQKNWPHWSIEYAMFSSNLNRIQKDAFRE